MYKSLLRLTLLLLALAPGVVLAADTRIAVLDVQRAVLEASSTKAALEALKTQYKSDNDAAEVLAKRIKEIEEKITKERDVMAAAELERLGREREEKLADLQHLAEKLRGVQQATFNEQMRKLGPKLQKILEEIMTADGYEIILNAQAVLLQKPTLDITRKVTERLNAGG